MGGTSAIVFIPDDTAKEELELPLMLQSLLFCPVAAWAAQSLSAVGVDRFFLVCHEKYTEQAVACFPQGAQVVTTASENPVEQLSGFLEGREGEQVIVMTKPALLLESGARLLTGGGPLPAESGELGLYRLEAERLKAGLDGGREFQTLLAEPPADGMVSPEALVGAMPVDSLEGLQRCLPAARRDVSERLVRSGAVLMDPETAYIDPRVQVGRGTLILPGSILRGKTVIGRNCEIGPNSMITDCVVGDGTTVNSSQLNESMVGDHTKIGPFAYVRPNCRIGDHIKVGDFVEVKNSVLGSGTKISHLTYVGDSDIGTDVNLGCGTVTVNYDGSTKARTVVGDNAFIGCNSNLIAPVQIGEGAYIAAGSTVTEDVPAGSLAIARAQQTIKKQWALKRRKS